MDKVRVLKWEHNVYGDDSWVAQTKFNAYVIDLVRGKYRLDAAYYIQEFDTLEQAQDGAEADYIARCSEFLRVAGPGECVVKVDQLIEVVAAACEACNKAGVCPCIHGVPMTCCVCASLTAAIDAAKGE